MRRWALLPLLALGSAAAAVVAAELPIFDAHVHYSHDAVELTPPKDAAAILRKAGLKRALVSSSGDAGTQKLLAEAPEIVIPSLRPYRNRSEVGTWARDETVVGFLEERLKNGRYAAIGEFHLFGADADLPVPRRLVQLAKQHGLVLHAHSDADAVERLFKQDPQARVLWAHSGFDRPEAIAAMLRKHKNLWSDLAYRSDHGGGGQVPPEWRALFTEFPDRFMVGTDTFTPERWHYLVEHAQWSRAWLATLPPELAERIAWRNGEALFAHWKPRAAAP
jgi:predicted TIM-barrel fold metal-dependent hydrolase